MPIAKLHCIAMRPFGLLVLLIGMLGSALPARAAHQTLSNTNASTSEMKFISPYSGRMDLFLRSKSNPAHLLHSQTDSTGALSSPEDLGGELDSGPNAVSWGSNHMAVFVIWDDGSVRYRTWNGIGFGSWVSLGGDFNKVEPGVVSMQPGHIAVFVKGHEHLYRREYSGGTWTPGWIDMGGDVRARPMAVSWAPGNMTVFITGDGQEIQYKQWSGASWSPNWLGLGGDWPHYPVPITRGPGLIDVFAVGNNKKIYVKHFSSGSWGPTWTSIGSKTFGSNPAVALKSSGSIQVFARASGTETFGGVSMYWVHAASSDDGGYLWSPWALAEQAGSPSGGSPVAGTGAVDGLHSHVVINNGAGTPLLFHGWEN